MTFPQGEIDIVATKILLDTQEALLRLKGLNNEINQTALKVATINDTVKKGVLGATGGIESATIQEKKFFDAMKIDPSTLAGLDKVRLVQSLISTTAGQMGGNIGLATAAVQKFAGALGLNSQLIRQVGSEMENAGNKGKGAFDRVFNSVNTLRIALGALVSMILFQFIQAITGTFKEAIDQARQFEQTIYRISNAERQLSMEGVEVSVQQLKKGIQDIKNALPIFSKEDIAQLIGGVATTTKELGFTGDQILKLGAAVAILNINSTETETLLQTQAKVTNSILSPQAKSIGSLGLAFGKANIEAKAFQLGILQTGQSFDDLTEKQKSNIKYAIVLQTAGIENINNLEDLRDAIKKAGGDYEALNNYLESNDAKLQSNSAAWHDLLTTVGQIILPFLPVLTDFFGVLNDGFNMAKVAIIEFTSGLATLGVVMFAVFTGQIKNIKDFTNLAKTSMDEFVTTMTNALFKEVPTNAPSWFKNFADRIKQAKETATGTGKGTEADNEETLKTLDQIDQKLEEISLDAKRAKEDLKLKLEQKQADLDLEYQRKAEDAAKNHAQKLEDINKDALQKIDDAKRKSREDEKKGEEDLLQKLKELRERFLLDLEDALHARDARQVLRLIREYQLDKQNLLDRKKLDDQQRKETLAANLAAIEEERKRRIETENIEYQRKLADLNTAKAREQADLETWYKREQEDIQRNVEEKIQKLLDGYITEGKLHEAQQSKIYGILKKYFAKDMALVDGLAQFMARRFAEVQTIAAQPIQLSPYAAPILSPATTASLTGSGSVPVTNTYKQLSPADIARVTGYAEGGTIIATRPTRAIFGERGAEMATFTPLGRTGRDVNKVFGDISGAGANGQIYVNVDLSPDLEARVIQKSADNVGNVISRVNNRKV